jgi:hypothetical protein
VGPIGRGDVEGSLPVRAVKRGQKHWRNGGPEGCVRDTSTVQSTAEQKATFAKIVERIKGEAEKRTK